MKLSFRRFDLRFKHSWMIASSLGERAKEVYNAALIELRDKDGLIGYGESAPSTRYQENVDSCIAFFERIDASRLSFDDVSGSMNYIEAIAPGNFSPKGAINIALLDGAAKKARQPSHEFLGLKFTEEKHVTSFTIGIDTPEKIRLKVAEAKQFPVLKIKVGAAADEINLAAVREVEPTKTLRVDANEGWKTKEEALQRLEWLARDPNIEFVEQPLPARNPPEDFKWLKERSPLTLVGDESYLGAFDVDRCAECFHGVNVKLCKTGGVSRGFEALSAARKAGLKTMLGCMIESSILTAAGAHLAELTNWLDLDGNQLINNDPFAGVTSENGVMSFRSATEPFGLRVCPR
jgi:L-Ala-D/L-Glu epimerase